MTYPKEDKMNLLIELAVQVREQSFIARDKIVDSHFEHFVPLFTKQELWEAYISGILAFVCINFENVYPDKEQFKAKLTWVIDEYMKQAWCENDEK